MLHRVVGPVAARVINSTARVGVSTLNVARRNLTRMPISRTIRMTASSPATFASRSFSSATEPFVATEPRETMEYDALIVGAGPSGLATAIRLKQLAAESGKEISVCVIEKGAEVGNHVLSGNVFETQYLEELIPGAEALGAPLGIPVTSEDFKVLINDKLSFASPILPPSMQNHGNRIISLGNLSRWLGEQAEALGVEVYTGFAAAEVLYEDGAVVGVATGDNGIGKDGQPTGSYARGVELRASQTFFAEGVRGSCSEDIIEKYNLREGRANQTYGIGIKEIWEVDPSKHKPGYVVHTVGWPAELSTYFGSFMYHAENNQVYIGVVIGLDYQNAYENPYMTFQKMKHHPEFSQYLEGGKCISYGARAINEGGFQSVPKVSFPGGVLVGCSAGFVNVPKIKGSHNAIKSGMLAAEALFERFNQGVTTPEDAESEFAGLAKLELANYETKIQESPIMAELKQVRNVRPSWKYGPLGFAVIGGLEEFITRGKLPFTLAHSHDRDCDATKPLAECKPINYPKPDGKLSFSLLDNLARANVYHDDNQPSHLKIKPGMENVPKESFEIYGGPESRFCPAAVYEYPEQPDGSVKLQINAQNCVHCKTCSIKTPKEFIRWTVPQGGEGPAYNGM